MTVDPELVKKVVVAQGCDTLSAYNVGKTDKLYYSERKSATDLCLEVDLCVASIQGPFRLEVWKGERGKGRPSEKTAPFVFILNGGQYHAQAPGSSGMEERLARIEAALMSRKDDQDDEDEDDGAMNGATTAKLVDVLVGLLPRMFAGAATPAAAPAPAPAPMAGTEQPGAASTDVDMDVMRAVMRLKKTSPAEYATYRDILLKTYGDGK